MNVEPLLGSDFTSMSPFSCWIIIFEIVKPKPIPPLLISFDLVMQPKNLKSLARSFGCIPIPVSITLVLNYWSSSKSNFIVIPPEKVNFTALPIMLNSTYLYLFISVTIYMGTLSFTMTSKSNFFSFSWNLIISVTSSIAYLIFANSLKRENLLFSILLISRASSTKFCKCNAEL